MKIINLSGELPEYHKVQIGLSPEKAAEEKSDSAEVFLIEEHRIVVFIGDRAVMQIVCTPTDLPELVLGRLVTEGYVRDVKNIRSIEICRNGTTATVRMEEPATGGDAEAFLGGAGTSDLIETVSTCCTDNRSLYGLLEKDMELQRVPEPVWEESWIRAMNERFKLDTKLHKLTHATHSCFLNLNGEIVYEAEDIGRHNAVDKAVGWALLNGVPLASCIIYTTGRMPVDMVRKVIRAGIPVMVSKEAPTLQGLELAREYGLTLIGNAKHGKMIVYNDPGKY